MFDTPKTKAMTKFLATEKDRVTGLSIELPDGVFIYTNSADWCDDAGAGTFRGDSETDAIKKFYERVQKAETETTCYTLQSSDMVYTPGIIAWAINGAAFEADRAQMINVIKETYSLPESVATDLVMGNIEYTIENECVVFTV